MEMARHKSIECNGLYVDPGNEITARAREIMHFRPSQGKDCKEDGEKNENPVSAPKKKKAKGTPDDDESLPSSFSIPAVSPNVLPPPQSRVELPIHSANSPNQTIVYNINIAGNANIYTTLSS